MTEPALLDRTTEWVSQPHRWHLLPKPSPQEMAQAVVQVLTTQAGCNLFFGLMHAYMLTDIPDEYALRHVGRQDVVKHLLEMAGLGVALRQQQAQEQDNGRSEWFSSL